MQMIGAEFMGFFPSFIFHKVLKGLRWAGFLAAICF